ncbi:MAG: Ig-like domain-containing protein, partial [Oscillospiraceae bacterium]|nr:Ig-like domain-containing protein [Oscillospiraceae bacterium]
SEVLSTSVLELNPYAQGKLEVLNASSDVFWFSSNPAIATVDETGLVSAVSAGTCQIQAFLNNKIMTCDVTVSDRYYYSVADSSELKLTDTDANVVLEFPEDPDGTVTWISANPDVVTVDSDGTIRALQNGKANILATYNGTTYMRVINVELGVVARSAVLAGDVNGDGTVDICDVVLCNRIYVGVENATAEQIQAGDVDGSGKIELSDSMILLRKLVGLD